MNKPITLRFRSQDIHVYIGSANASKILFVCTDILCALGYANPCDALRRYYKGLTESLSAHSPESRKTLDVIEISNLGILLSKSRMPSVPCFQEWLALEALPAIRKARRASPPDQAPSPTPGTPPSALSAAGEFQALYGIARLIGMDGRAAAIRANQATTALTGVNILQLLALRPQ